MEEKAAINVTDEAADVFYNNVHSLPKSIKKRVSCHMLHEIFKHMVVPAIDHAKKLDRDYGDA